MNDVYVFLGPTLPVETARTSLDARYLPPVVGGDVQRLMARSPRMIGIVDGLFEQMSSVFHKEILYALSRGVRVFGASSMGALRAAELHPFGMVGVGRIFEQYLSGELEDDDEVAVNHGPRDQGYKLHSEAMVNLRAGLEQARRAGILAEPTRVALERLAKKTFYVERSWKQLLFEGRAAGLPPAELDALADFVARVQPNRKRDDAIEMLQRMASELSSPAPTPAPSFDFEATSLWGQMRLEAIRALPFEQDQEGDAEVEDALGLEAARLHVQVFAKGREANLRSALMYAMIEAQSERMYLRAEEREIERVLGRMAIDLGPAPAPALRRLAAMEVLGEKLSAALEVEDFLPLALVREGQLAGLLKDFRDQRRWLRPRGLEMPTLQDAGVDPRALLDWFRARSGVDKPSLESYAEEFGLTEGDLITTLLRCYLFETQSEAR